MIVQTKLFKNFIQNITSVSFEKRNYNLILFLTVISILISLIFFYILSINTLSGAGYTIKNKEKILYRLRTENLLLKEELAKLNAPKNLSELARNLNLVENKSTDFMKVDKTAFNLKSSRISKP